MTHKLFLATFALFFICAPAFADQLSYGDFLGSDVMYLNVSEDTRVNGDMSDFGSPTIINNTLDFDPTDFASQSFNSGSDINDAQLNFQLMANEGQAINNVLFEEGGDFTLAGLGAAQATASYGAAIFYEIVEIDGVAVAGPSGSAGFSDMFALPGDQGTAVIWNNSLTIDFATVLSDANIAGSVTKVEFAIDNTLTTAAADGGSSFIAKKDVGLEITANIPEPSTGIVLLGGIAVMVIRRKR